MNTEKRRSYPRVKSQKSISQRDQFIFFFFKAQDLQSIVVHELLIIDYNTTINHVTLGQDIRIASYSL